MRLSLMCEDGSVIKDGNGFVDLVYESPVEVRALQWYGLDGEVEYHDGTEAIITELPQWVSDAVTIMEAHRLSLLPDHSAEELATKASELEDVLLAYPKAEQFVVDKMCNFNYPNINITPFYRPTDNNLIGVQVTGYMFGTTGITSYIKMINHQNELGVPLFAVLAPKDEDDLEQVRRLVENYGSIFFETLTDSKFSYPEWTLDLAKAQKMSALSVQVETKANEGFLWEGHLFDTNASGRANIAGKVVQLLLDPTIETVAWRLKTNVDVVLSVADFKIMATALTTHFENIYKESWLKKYQVEQVASTLEEVAAI